MFFKIGHVVVDVEDGNVMDTINGKVMRIDYTNMTAKPFGAQSKLSPIRFNEEKELMMWHSIRNRWLPIKTGLHPDVAKAIIKLTELKIEKELLG
jgi:hypothetical protein